MNAEKPESSSAAAPAPPLPSVHTAFQITQTPSGMEQHVAATFHAGPLPPARELAAYDQAHAGAAAWILQQAELNAEHVREMERLGARLQTRDALLLRLLPFCFVTLFVMCATVIAIWGNVWFGGSLLASALGGVGLAYLKNSGGVKPR